MMIYTHTLVEVYSLTKVVFIRQRILTLKINIFNTFCTYICVTNIKSRIEVYQEQMPTYYHKISQAFQKQNENNKRSR
ncbi:hypothetical protein HanPI659440_Chr00c18g0733881 [Helianthus annuus]|nr:hypothetical protein HanPI659440_Chr00c18g0733881 [Helianthus annuus]